jgi:hypothetical protein
MRKALSIVMGAALLVAGLALPALATWGPGCQDTKDYAVKFAANSDGSGVSDYECGNAYQTGTEGVRDDNFGGTAGYGAIENMNDKANWMKAWNNDNAVGMCVTLYKDDVLSGKDYDVYVAPGDIVTMQLGVLSDQVTSVQGVGATGSANCQDKTW